MRVACLSEISEAAPHNSASRFGERFFAKARFEKRRNPVCTRKGHAASVRLLRRQRLRNISSFSNRRIGGKDPPKRAGAIARCCLRRIGRRKCSRRREFFYAIRWPLITSAKCSPSFSAARRHRSMRSMKISKYSITAHTSVSMASVRQISLSVSVTSCFLTE